MKTIGRSRRNGIAVGGSAPKKPTPGVSLDLAEELKRQESPRLPSKPTHPDLEPPLSFFPKEGRRERGRTSNGSLGQGLSQTISIRITPRQRLALQLHFHLVPAVHLALAAAL